MSMGKLVLLLVNATAQSYASTSPNATPPASELREQTEIWERFLPKVAQFQSLFLWPVALAESAVLFAASGFCPPALSQQIINLLIRGDMITRQSALARVSSLTPAFLVGSISIVAGSLVRMWCYRTLGRMFTFELSIRKEHKLVTSGPYSIVRHPSYTGGAAVFLGTALCQFTHGSWFVNCSGLFPRAEPKLTMVLVVMWALYHFVMGSAIVGRINKEDTMLSRNFGDEWREWAKRVPYKLVPGLY